MPTLHNVTISGNKSRQQRDVLVDTGASRSFIRRELATALGVLTPLDPPLRFTLANGETAEFADSVELILSTPEDLVVSDAFIVMEAPVADVILGEKTIQEHKLTIDYKRGAIYALLTHDEKKPESFPLPRKESFMTEVLKTLMTKLQLPMSDEMTDEQAIAAIVAKASPNAQMSSASSAVLALLGLPKEAKEPEVRGAILALQHPGNVVPAEQYHAVVTELAGLKREQFFLAALNDDGKITPAEAPAMRELMAKDFDTFAAFIAKRGRQVPLGVTRPPAFALARTADEPNATAAEQLILAVLQEAKAKGQEITYKHAAIEAARRQPALFQL